MLRKNEGTHFLVLGFGQTAARVIHPPVDPGVVGREGAEMILEVRHAASPVLWRRDHSAAAPGGNRAALSVEKAEPSETGEKVLKE